MLAKKVFTVNALAAMASAASHTVMVGQGGLKFVPSSLTAASGDTVEFIWAAGGHSVAQGSFANPCQPSDSSAFYSGDIEASGQTWTLTLNSSDPVYFYCAVPGHCQAGMVGAINAPSGMSESDYASAANSASDSSAPASAQGGILNAPAAASSSAAPSSTASSSSAASSSTASSAAASSSVASSSAASTASTETMSSAAITTATPTTVPAAANTASSSMAVTSGSQASSSTSAPAAASSAMMTTTTSTGGAAAGFKISLMSVVSAALLVIFG